MAYPKKQKGAVLVTAMIIMILITIIGVTSMSSGILELRMSSNEEERLHALQTAQAAADEIASRRSNFVVSGNPGATRCTSNAGCGSTTLNLGSPAHKDKNNNLVTEVTVTRLFPAFGPPPRMEEGKVYDVTNTEATYFQIDAEYNPGGLGQGARGSITQGYVMLIPKIKP